MDDEELKNFLIIVNLQARIGSEDNLSLIIHHRGKEFTEEIIA